MFTGTVSVMCPYCNQSIELDANYYQETELLCCQNCNKSFDTTKLPDPFEWSEEFRTKDY